MTTCCNTESDCATRTTATVKPRYTVNSTAESHTVMIDLPGIPKSGVTIDLEKDILTVKATGRPSVPDTWKPLHVELAPADYLLRLRVDAPIQEDRITATTVDGVLTLVLPVAETAKPRRIELS